MVECAIATKKGTKVADVAWASPERLAIIWPEVECSIAPELCVEVLSSTNTSKEMQTKRQLYFENGALEVWTCDANGNMAFFSPAGSLAHSILFPDFPLQLN